MRDPKYILFKEEHPLTSGKKGVLFKTQRELANAIAQIDAGYEAKTLEPFLSQIFKRADQPGSKPIPTKLLNAIIAVSRPKLSSDFQEEFGQELEDAFSELKRYDLDTTGFFASKQFMSWSLESRACYTFSHEIDVIFWNEKQIGPTCQIENRFSRIIFSEQRSPSLHFYFPQLSTAIEFWNAVYEVAILPQLIDQLGHSFQAMNDLISKKGARGFEEIRFYQEQYFKYKDGLYPLLNIVKKLCDISRGLDSYLNSIASEIAYQKPIDTKSLSFVEELKRCLVSRENASKYRAENEQNICSANEQGHITVSIINSPNHYFLPIVFFERGDFNHPERLLFSISDLNYEGIANTLQYSEEYCQYWYKNSFLPLIYNPSSTVPLFYKDIISRRDAMMAVF